MNKPSDNRQKNFGDLVRQRLKSLSLERGRTFDEILRYYAMERFLYRLSISPYAKRFFLKGGLMLKVWDSTSHRATMDIDLLARTSNHIENLQHIISEVAAITCEQDAITFDTKCLTIHETQAGGEYKGARASFLANLSTTKMPVLIDIGFNDIIIPNPQKILYPTLLNMPEPTLLGYTLETVIAEKLESIVKLGLVNTRMKDFYDLMTLLETYKIDQKTLLAAIKEVFENRKTPPQYPAAFSPIFYANHETQKRWKTFLSSIRENHIEFKEVIDKISLRLGFLKDPKLLDSEKKLARE